MPALCPEALTKVQEFESARHIARGTRHIAQCRRHIALRCVDGSGRSASARIAGIQCAPVARQAAHSILRCSGTQCAPSIRDSRQRHSSGQWHNSLTQDTITYIYNANVCPTSPSTTVGTEWQKKGTKMDRLVSPIDLTPAPRVTGGRQHGFIVLDELIRTINNKDASLGGNSKN